ncbi:MAG: dethiobiotin synthase, partial [Desulfovibrio sp.]|nr:dethiobiotin synthase [Desulfovibrio sp.]
MQVPGFVVSGVGTDVGKTVVLSSLLRGLIQKGKKVEVIKIVQTGDEDPNTCDSKRYQESVSDLSVPPIHVLHSFPKPVSPHLASQCRLSVEQLAQEIGNLRTKSHADLLLFETAGGLYVPLNQNELMFDLLCTINLPIILVTSTKLGSINHTLLSTKAITPHLTLLACVASCTEKIDDPTAALIHEDTQLYLRTYFQKQHIPFFCLNYTSSWEDRSTSLTALTDLLTQTKQSPSDLAERDKKILWHPYSTIDNQEILT